MVSLTELAEAAGILSSYIDQTGIERHTDDEVRRFFLKAQGIPAETEEERLASFANLTRTPLLPEVIPFFDSETVTLAPQCTVPCRIEITDESGRIVWRETVVPGKKAVVTGLPVGYYDITATITSPSAETVPQTAREQSAAQTRSLLIIAPEKCYLPKFIKDKKRIYGVSVMMYALRSENNIGIGDFGSLQDLVRITAAHGGDVIGISPLGAMSPCTLPSPVSAPLKGDVSPYRTLSRMFINYIYLDIKSEPDFQASPTASAFLKDAGVATEIRRLNTTPNVEYASVLRLKRHLLEMMYQTFQSAASEERKHAFATYKKQKGEELENLCLFETILERHPEDSFWRNWQDGTGDINSPATAAVKNENQERMDFYAYCHWLADLQLKKTQELARSLNMKIGLYTDMPIGAASNGAEVWENPGAYVLDAGVGAPPDPMCPCGQSWGFNPYHPIELQKQHYRPFIRLVRENMQYSGALRIDHAMGMFRLFWGFFAPGNPIVQGAYVKYNLKAMITILALESNRSGCLLIGEALGTVPDGFREYLEQHGLLSYTDFILEKEKDGTFSAPNTYSYLSLAQSSTHDQATAIGLWTNEDIKTFRQCGMYATETQYNQSLNDRRTERKNMIKAFTKEGLLSDESKAAMDATVENGETAPKEIGDILNTFCAKSNSALYLPRLCDIFKQQKMDNAPGIIDAYPNWRLKMEKTVSEIRQSPEFRAAMDEIRKYRPQ